MCIPTVFWGPGAHAIGEGAAGTLQHASQRGCQEIWDVHHSVEKALPQIRRDAGVGPSNPAATPREELSTASSSIAHLEQRFPVCIILLSLFSPSSLYFCMGFFSLAVQWPHRKLRSLEKKIASLRAEQRYTTGQLHASPHPELAALACPPMLPAAGEGPSQSLRIVLPNLGKDQHWGPG